MIEAHFLLKFQIAFCFLSHGFIHAMPSQQFDGENDTENPTDSIYRPVETQQSDSIYDTGIFTKYPDSPTENIDSRRKRNVNETTSPIQGQANLQHSSQNGSHSEKVPLPGVIGAIESQILNSAGEINRRDNEQHQTRVKRSENPQEEKSENVKESTLPSSTSTEASAGKKKNDENNKAKMLNEKVAEIEANPVILSTSL